jgi:hypothetical protein
MNKFYRTILQGGGDPNPMVLIIKSDNSGDSNNDQFKFNRALGQYDVIAKNLSTLNVQTFTGLVNEQTITFTDGAGTYELLIYPSGVTPMYRLQFANQPERLKVLECKQFGKAIVWQQPDSMFRGCSNMILSAKDSPNFDSSATNIINMLEFIGNTTLDISNWDFKNITEFSQAFRNMANLTTIKANNPTMNVGTQFSSTFAQNPNLVSIDLTGVTFENATQIPNMFGSNPELTTVLGHENFDFSEVTAMNLFSRESRKIQWSVGNWNPIKVQTLEFAFFMAFGSPHVNGQIVDTGIGNWSVPDLTNAGSMFSNLQLPTATYDALLTGWTGWTGGVPTKSLQNSVSLGMGTSQYTGGGDEEDARNYLTDTIPTGKEWVITDGGVAP